MTKRFTLDELDAMLRQLDTEQALAKQTWRELPAVEIPSLAACFDDTSLFLKAHRTQHMHAISDAAYRLLYKAGAYCDDQTRRALRGDEVTR